MLSGHISHFNTDNDNFPDKYCHKSSIKAKTNGLTPHYLNKNWLYPISDLAAGQQKQQHSSALRQVQRYILCHLARQTQCRCWCLPPFPTVHIAWQVKNNTHSKISSKWSTSSLLTFHDVTTKVDNHNDTMQGVGTSSNYLAKPANSCKYYLNQISYACHCSAIK